LVNQAKPIVAIFGGSFDPPHKGHQQIVEHATQNLEIDKLLVVPAYLNPFKHSSMASASKRLEWCQTLFANSDKVIVEDYEIKQGKSTYTSETVKHFNMQYNVKYLIIGADNLSSLSKWHDFEMLNSQVTWVIATREGYRMDVNGLKNWIVLTLNAPVSSTEIREAHTMLHVDKKIEESVKNTLKDTSK
jgi:nicotinate-nucleotide adenylyltransferase